MRVYPLAIAALIITAGCQPEVVAPSTPHQFRAAPLATQDVPAPLKASRFFVSPRMAFTGNSSNSVDASVVRSAIHAALARAGVQVSLDPAETDFVLEISATVDDACIQVNGNLKGIVNVQVTRGSAIVDTLSFENDLHRCVERPFESLASRAVRDLVASARLATVAGTLHSDKAAAVSAELIAPPEGVRDLRKSRQAPRPRAILVTEITGLERLWSTTRKTAPDAPMLLRRLTEAYAELEAAAQRDNANGAAQVKLARRKAIDNYTLIVNDYPTYAQLDEVLYYLAYEYEQASDLKNARSVYYDLIKKRPDSQYIPNAYLAFGELFFAEAQGGDTTKLDLAVQAYSEVIKYPAPSNKVLSYAWYKLAHAFRRKGETDKASNAFNKAIELGDTYPQMPGAVVVAEAARKDAGKGHPSVPAWVAGRPQPSLPATIANTPGPTPPTSPDSIAGPQTSAFDVVAASPQPASFALIVGIESYRTLPVPTGARTDAARVETLMRRTFGLTQERVRVLTDAQATRSDIISGLEWLKNNAKAGSRVYFYFSGHGSPDPSSGTAYLLPYESNQDNLLQSGIKLEDVSNMLAQTKAKEAVAIIDSCFSGTGDRSLLAPGARALTRVREVTAPSQVLMLSASRASETSGPSSSEKIGLFTKFITEGLGKGAADVNGDGQITAQELYDWVAPRVTRDALAQHRNQTPQITIGNGLGGASQVVLGYGYR